MLADPEEEAGDENEEEEAQGFTQASFYVFHACIIPCHTRDSSTKWDFLSLGVA